MIKRFPLKVKPFRNTTTYQNLLEEVPPPSPPLIKRWGMSLHVRLPFQDLSFVP